MKEEGDEAEEGEKGESTIIGLTPPPPPAPSSGTSASEKTEGNSNIDMLPLGEVVLANALIVFDNMTEVADNCPKFASFLTVSRKFGYNCIYIIHTMKPSWTTMIIQTKVFVFFKLGTIPPTLRSLISDHSMRNDKYARQTARRH